MSPLGQKVKIRSGGSGSSVGARISDTAGTTIPSSIDTSLILGDTDRDSTPSFIDAANSNALTIPVGGAGKYIGVGRFRMTTLASGYAQIRIDQYRASVRPSTNIPEVRDSFIPGGAVELSVSDLFAGEEGDWFMLTAFQTSGSDKVVTEAYLSLELIGT
jgi:hypothetical protein